MNPRKEPCIHSELFRQIVDDSDFGILLFDSEELVYANGRADELLGVTRSTTNLAADLLPFEVYKILSAWNEVESQAQQSEEVELRFASGDAKWIEMTVSTIKVGNDKLNQLVMRDITKSKRREASLEREATTDDLSGLSNRRQFRRTLDSQSRQLLCLAVVDLDHFKSINDSFGHHVGDNAIRFVASKLLEHFGDEPCVARLGGEEFGIVVNASQPELVEKRFEEFRRAIELGQINNQAIKLTVSIGLAFANSNNDISELLCHADEALYQSKNSGRNRVTTFTR